MCCGGGENVAVGWKASVCPIGQTQNGTVLLHRQCGWTGKTIRTFLFVLAGLQDPEAALVSLDTFLENNLHCVDKLKQFSLL